MISIKHKILFLFTSVFAVILLSGSGCDSGDDPKPSPEPEPYWEEVTIENNTQVPNDVYFAERELGWIIGDSGSVLKTTDTGINWNIQYLGSENLNAILPVNDSTLWIVGDNGAIFKSTDQGDNWQKKASPVVADFKSIYMLGDKGWIVGVKDDFNGIVIHTENGGQTWEWQIPPENTPGLNDVYFMKPMTGIAVGDRGKIIITHNGGNDWEILFNSSKFNLNTIEFVNDTLGFIMGNSGEYLRSYNEGESWNLQNITFWEDLKQLQFVNLSIGWIVGSSSASYRTIDRSLTWQYMGVTDDVDFNSVHFTNIDHGWAVGEKNNGIPVVLKATNN